MQRQAGPDVMARTVRMKGEVHTRPEKVGQHGLHLSHGGVAPEAQLVLAEAVAGQQLPLVPVPLQRAHLRPRELWSLNGLLTGMSMDDAIGSTERAPSAGACCETVIA